MLPTEDGIYFQPVPVGGMIGYIEYSICGREVTEFSGTICGTRLVAQTVVSANESAKVSTGRRWNNTVLWCILLGLIVLVFMRFPRTIGHGITAANACAANLRQIEGAKAEWALDYHRQPGDLPTEAVLFGPGRYRRFLVKCPGDGVYTIGTLGENPRCSMAEHYLQFKTDQRRNLQFQKAQRRSR